jgi:hypothetical protein
MRLLLCFKSVPLHVVRHIQVFPFVQNARKCTKFEMLLFYQSVHVLMCTESSRPL